MNLIELRDVLDTLTDEERMFLFYYYCTYCGRIENRQKGDDCKCMRDD